MNGSRILTLTYAQEGELRDAIIASFTRDRLREALFYRLGKRLDVISDSGSPETDYFKLLERARMEGWQLDLLRALREANPGSPDLIAFVGRNSAGLTASTPQLEQIVRDRIPGLPLAIWRQQLGEIEFQVCRIEIPEGRAVGTGFLVGPDVVMTNYHVLERVIGGAVSPARVALRFDFKQIPGTEVVLNPGTVHTLADDWLLDESRYSDSDLLPDPFAQPGEPDRLDYALVRLGRKAGEEPVGGVPDTPEAPRRGWIAVPPIPHVFTRDTPLLIAQHPAGRPLEIAIDMESVLGVNAGETRVRYRTNTEPGSSGSPCFNVHWDWVALHHSGDPKSGPLYKPQYNAGIPLSAILALLEQRGKRGLLGKPEE